MLFFIPLLNYCLAFSAVAD